MSIYFDQLTGFAFAVNAADVKAGSICTDAVLAAATMKWVPATHMA
jgi:hypothetical protein